MLGYTVEEWLATPNFWLTIVHPDDREAAAKHAQEHFAAGDFRVNTFRWLTKDGRAIWVESHSMVVKDDDGTPAGMRGVTLDITPRKRAEDSLRFLARVSELVTSSLDCAGHARKRRRSRAADPRRSLRHRRRRRRRHPPRRRQARRSCRWTTTRVCCRRSVRVRI